MPAEQSQKKTRAPQRERPLPTDLAGHMARVDEAYGDIARHKQTRAGVFDQKKTMPAKQWNETLGEPWRALSKKFNQDKNRALEGLEKFCARRGIPVPKGYERDSTREQGASGAAPGQSAAPTRSGHDTAWSPDSSSSGGAAIPAPAPGSAAHPILVDGFNFGPAAAAARPFPAAAPTAAPFPAHFAAADPAPSTTLAHQVVFPAAADSATTWTIDPRLAFNPGPPATASPTPAAAASPLPPANATFDAWMVEFDRQQREFEADNVRREEALMQRIRAAGMAQQVGTPVTDSPATEEEKKDNEDEAMSTEGSISVEQEQVEEASAARPPPEFFTEEEWAMYGLFVDGMGMNQFSYGF